MQPLEELETFKSPKSSSQTWLHIVITWGAFKQPNAWHLPTEMLT